jgi:hypothetical protein
MRFDIGGIEVRSEIVQEMKYETLAAPGPGEEDPSGFDIYSGPPPRQIAHVSTKASGGKGSRPKSHRFPRLNAYERHK